MTTLYDKTIEYTTLTGIVTSSKKFTETNVCVSGGGATVSGFGNFTSVTTNPVYTSDDSYVNHEIWLAIDNGKEKSVKLYSGDIPLREGQRITVVYIKNKGITDAMPAAIINHNNKKKYKVISSARACVNLKLCKYKKNIDYEKSYIFGGVCGILTWVTCGASGVVTSDLIYFIPFIGGFVAFGSVVLYRKSKNNQIQEIINDFNSKLDRTIDDIAEYLMP